MAELSRLGTVFEDARLKVNGPRSRKYLAGSVYRQAPEKAGGLKARLDKLAIGKACRFTRDELVVLSRYIRVDADILWELEMERRNPNSPGDDVKDFLMKEAQRARAESPLSAAESFFVEALRELSEATGLPAARRAGKNITVAEVDNLVLAAGRLVQAAARNKRPARNKRDADADTDTDTDTGLDLGAIDFAETLVTLANASPMQQWAAVDIMAAHLRGCRAAWPTCCLPKALQSDRLEPHTNPPNPEGA